MQRAAFILHVADPMAMIGMPAGCGVILDIGDGGLAFEHVHGMIEHHRDDAGDLREQKQPKKPRAEAPLRVQQQQCPPLDLDVPVELGTTSRTRKPASGILFGFVAAEPQILRRPPKDDHERSVRPAAGFSLRSGPLTVARGPMTYINIV